MTRLKRQFISSLLIVGLCGCGGGLRMLERPQSTAGALKQAGQLYELLWQRDQSIHTLKASARVRFSRGVFSRAVEQALVVKRPADMRLDSYTLVGDLVHQLILHDGMLWVYDARSGRIENDSDVEGLLAKNFGLALSVGNIISILVGSVPLENRGDYLAMTRKQGDVLRGLQSQILIDPVSRLPQHFSGYTQRDEFYEISYSDYHQVGGISFPHRIAVVLSKPRVSLEISFKDVDINSPVADSKFIYEKH